MTSIRLAPAAEVRATIAAETLAPSTIPAMLGTIRLSADQQRIAARVLQRILSCGGALLAEPVGTGKTYVALAVAARSAGEVLVVVPAALREMWRVALDAAAVRGTIVTQEALSRGAALPHGASFIIVDEAHRFREPGTQRYARLADACRRAKILLVTATPIQNRRDDLAAQLALFLGRAAWGLDADALAAHVVRASADSADRGRPGLPRQDGPRPITLPVDDDCLERIVSLPPPVAAKDESLAAALLTYGLVHQWTSSRAALVAALRRRRGRGLALLDAVRAGRMPTRAELAAWTQEGDTMQLAFPELVAGADSDARSTSLGDAIDAHVAAVSALLEHCRSSPNPDVARAGALQRIRSDHPGERIIAFCHYAETAAGLRRLMRSAPGVAMLTARGAEVASGRISRESVLSQFTPGQPAASAAQRIDLLITTDLLSEGVNLQEASVVIHLDLPWNPARLEQRVGRVRRLGSRHDVVTVYAIAPPASSERLIRIEARLRDKLRVAQRTVGIAGHILPSPTGFVPAAGDAERRGEVDRRLHQWIGAGAVSADDHVVLAAAVESPIDGWLALVRERDGTHLVASLGGAPSDETESILRALELACGSEALVSHETMETVVREVAACLAARRAALAVDLKAATVASARRAALTRVARAIARVPRHRRAQLAPLADAARAVGAAHLGEGAERVLDMLVRSDLPDEPWLRSIAAFCEVNARTFDAPANVGSAAGASAGRLTALIVFRRPTLQSGDDRTTLSSKTAAPRGP